MDWEWKSTGYWVRVGKSVIEDFAFSPPLRRFQRRPLEKPLSKLSDEETLARRILG